MYFAEIVGPTGELEFSYISNKTLPLIQQVLDEEYFKIFETLKTNLTVEANTSNETIANNETLANNEILANNQTNSTDSVNTTDSGINKTVTPINRTTPNDTYTFKMKSKIGEIKTSEVKTKIPVNKNYTYPLPLSRKKLREAKSKLDTLDRNDDLRLRTMERRNFLESFLYDKKEWLESSQDTKKVIIYVNFSI